MSGIEPKVPYVQCEYDFAKDGGAVGAITMRGGGLPIGAIVTGGTVLVPKAVTSAGSATVALHLESAGDVLAATGKASLTIGTTIPVVPVNSTATNITTTAAAPVTLTIAGAAVTAGAVKVKLEYWLP